MEKLKPVFQGEQYKTLIKNYPLRKRKFYFSTGLALIIEIGLICGSVFVIAAAYIIQPTYGFLSGFVYFAGVIIFIPAVYYLYYEIKMIQLGNGLRLYKDGFLLPVDDFNAQRIEPAFIDYFKVDAVWFATETDKKLNLQGKGINLGDDPIKVWGQERCSFFDLKHNPIPHDILIVRLDLQILNRHVTMTTGAATIENGQEAMNMLVKNILNAKGVQYLS